MPEQIRSADLLVKSALANPEILDALRNKPTETLKSLALEATQNLPRVLPEPNKKTNNAIWLIVVIAFALVMLGSAYVLGTGVNTQLVDGGTYVG